MVDNRQERFRAMTHLYYRDAAGAVIVYDCPPPGGFLSFARSMIPPCLVAFQQPLLRGFRQQWDPKSRHLERQVEMDVLEARERGQAN